MADAERRVFPAALFDDAPMGYRLDGDVVTEPDGQRWRVVARDVLGGALLCEKIS